MQEDLSLTILKQNKTEFSNKWINCVFLFLLNERWWALPDPITLSPMLSRASLSSGYTADAQWNPLPKFFGQEAIFKALNQPPQKKKKKPLSLNRSSICQIKVSAGVGVTMRYIMGTLVDTVSYSEMKGLPDFSAKRSRNLFQDNQSSIVEGKVISLES